MFTDGQLRQLSQNRQRPIRARTVGVVAKGLVDKLHRRAEQQAALLRIVMAVTDDEFQRHCTTRLMAKGTLAILVDDPRWVQPMRVRWLFPLMKQLQAVGRGIRIGRIVFHARTEGFAGSGQDDKHTSTQPVGNGKTE